MLVLLFAFSCHGNVDDQYLQQRKQLRQNSQISVTQEPDNYYYQAPGVRSGGYQQQYAPPVVVQPQYYYQPPVVQPYVPPSYQAPGSRFYSNPYAIPPANSYQRYDIDQYYVPPTRYRNIERQQNYNSSQTGALDNK